ncbi:MAG TPA: DUF2780 domain-containing protein [Thermodesulfobacteriota bacterium]|nr:DUF2780 domain-containing protein [Thermodesulfobacteriota bacterium]
MKNSVLNGMGVLRIAVCIFSILGFAVGQALVQTPAAAQTQSPSPELVGKLTKELKVTREQATGGAGALFGLAKSRLKPEEFSQVSKAVPGMNGFLKAAPKQDSGSPLGSLSSALPSEAGGLTSVAGSFNKLGLSPNMVSKFVPVLTEFVKSKGGAKAGSLLVGALK